VLLETFGLLFRFRSQIKGNAAAGGFNGFTADPEENLKWIQRQVLRFLHQLREKKDWARSVKATSGDQDDLLASTLTTGQREEGGGGTAGNGPGGGKPLSSRGCESWESDAGILPGSWPPDGGSEGISTSEAGGIDGGTGWGTADNTQASKAL